MRRSPNLPGEAVGFDDRGNPLFVSYVPITRPTAHGTEAYWAEQRRKLSAATNPDLMRDYWNDQRDKLRTRCY
jgi:hypothetical protein